MSAADYLLCDGCGRKLYYRNEAGSPGDELPDGAVLFCADCAARRVLSSSAVVVVATTEAAAGFQKRAEWAYQVAGHAEPWGQTQHRYRAEERLYAYLEQVPDAKAHLVTRNVYEGPWEATDA